MKNIKKSKMKSKKKDKKTGEKKTRKKRKRGPKGGNHTQNPRRFPGFTVVVVIFSKSSTISMILFRNVSLSRGKSTTRFAASRFFRRKVAIFIGRETKTHIFRRKSTKKSLRSAHLTIIILLEWNNHSTTTTIIIQSEEVPF